MQRCRHLSTHFPLEVRSHMISTNHRGPGVFSSILLGVFSTILLELAWGGHELFLPPAEGPTCILDTCSLTKSPHWRWTLTAVDSSIGRQSTHWGSAVCQELSCCSPWLLLSIAMLPWFPTCAGGLELWIDFPQSEALRLCISVLEIGWKWTKATNQQAAEGKIPF